MLTYFRTYVNPHQPTTGAEEDVVFGLERKEDGTTEYQGKQSKTHPKMCDRWFYTVYVPREVRCGAVYLVVALCFVLMMVMMDATPTNHQTHHPQTPPKKQQADKAERTWPPRLFGPFEQGVPGAEAGDPEKMATKVGQRVVVLGLGLVWGGWAVFGYGVISTRSVIPTQPTNHTQPPPTGGRRRRREGRAAGRRRRGGPRGQGRRARGGQARGAGHEAEAAAAAEGAEGVPPGAGAGGACLNLFCGVGRPFRFGVVTSQCARMFIYVHASRN